MSKINDISAILKNQIKNYGKKISISEEGEVISVGDGIALVSGLQNVVLGELLKLPHDTLGMALNLEEDVVGVVLLSNSFSIKEGDKVKRTNHVISVPVGDELIGRVVNSIGAPQDGGKKITSKKFRDIFKVAPGVMTRQEVDQPLETGIIAIDSMIPIGKGQRELIIGDRQTGKTAIAIDTIINQKGKNIKCIYVAIGQKNSTISQIVEKLKRFGAMEYTTIVSSTASEATPLQYIAPYAGVTIAEEWMSKGEDVLIVYDDFSKHAIAYRTLSLLLRRPPGREAYPGDIFYVHSSLLERAARLNKEHGGGSITALPIIETQAGDISAYIPTNVISITDGQIFTVSSLFNSGQRPAIDAGYSVSRVGSNAQIKAMKKVASSLKLELAQYNEMAAFAQFGSDLDSETKKILSHGKKVLEIIKQKQYNMYESIDEVLILFALKERLFNPIPLTEVTNFKKKLIALFKENKEAKLLRNELQTKQEIDQNLEIKLFNKIKEFVQKYISFIPKYDKDKYEAIPTKETKAKAKAKAKASSTIKSKVVKQSNDDLKTMTLVNLRKEASKLKIKNTSSLKKDELIKLIKKERK